MNGGWEVHELPSGTAGTDADAVLLTLILHDVKESVSVRRQWVDGEVMYMSDKQLDSAWLIRDVSRPFYHLSYIRDVSRPFYHLSYTRDADVTGTSTCLFVLVTSTQVHFTWDLTGDLDSIRRYVKQVQEQMEWRHATLSLDLQGHVVMDIATIICQYEDGFVFQ